MHSAYWEAEVDPDGRLDQMMEWLAEHGNLEMAIKWMGATGLEDEEGVDNESRDQVQFE
jgi:hypothetical protein